MYVMKYSPIPISGSEAGMRKWYPVLHLEQRKRLIDVSFTKDLLLSPEYLYHSLCVTSKGFE